MDDIAIEQWSRVKAQGKGKYIFFHWILCAAIPGSILLAVIRGIFVGEGISYYVSGRFVGGLFLSILLCTLVALIAGNRKWNSNERKYAGRV